MGVVPEGTTPCILARPGDLARPQTRAGGCRSIPSKSGFPCWARIPGTPANEARIGSSADSVAAANKWPTGMSAAEMTMSMRPTINDCLSSIGLPGEETATFVPLIIEPYDPAPPASVTIATDTTATDAITTAVEPPPSPLTPPTASPQPSPSAAAATGATSSHITPRPPPGSALQRFSSCRRNVVRQTSNASGGGGGGGGAAAVPASPHTSSPAATAAEAQVVVSPLTPPPVVFEVPVVVFDTSVAAPLSAADSGPTASSFLDPAKPAVRRLLPPLLRASQALYDISTDASSAADDGGGSSIVGSSPTLPTSRGSGGFAGGSSAVIPAGCTGGSGGQDPAPRLSCAEPQEGTTSTSAMELPLPPSPPPPPLTVDIYELPSARGRRSLPPMDSLRTSATTVPLTLDSFEAEQGTTAMDMVTTPSELSYSAASPPGTLDVTTAASVSAFAVRRSVPLRLPWDADGQPTLELRSPVGIAATEAVENLHDDGGGGGDDGDVGTTAAARGLLVRQTSSFNTSGSSGSFGGGPVALDTPRLRSRSSVMPEVPLMALSIGGSLGGGGVSASKERGRLYRANSVSLATPRTAAAAVATATAALPPILDRGGTDRRQTST